MKRSGGMNNGKAFTLLQQANAQSLKYLASVWIPQNRNGLFTHRNLAFQAALGQVIWIDSDQMPDYQQRLRFTLSVPSSWNFPDVRTMCDRLHLRIIVMTRSLRFAGVFRTATFYMTNHLWNMTSYETPAVSSLAYRSFRIYFRVGPDELAASFVEGITPAAVRAHNKARPQLDLGLHTRPDPHPVCVYFANDPKRLATEEVFNQSFPLVH